MNPAAYGCFACGERRRDIKRLVSQGRHDEWAGRPVGPIREQIAALRREQRECNHRLTEPQRSAVETEARTTAATTRSSARRGSLVLDPPPLKDGQVRCPVCRNGARLTPQGYVRAHRDLFGHACYNRAPAEAMT